MPHKKHQNSSPSKDHFHGVIENLHQKQPARRQVAKQTENAAVFIPVRVSAAGSGALEIVHPRGHVLRVPAVFDEGALQRVLEVLDQQGDK